MQLFSFVFLLIYYLWCNPFDYFLFLDKEIIEPDIIINNKLIKKTDINPCCVCLEYARTIFFVSDNDSCGHICVCEYCALKLYECPLCRFEGNTVTAYF